LECGCFGNIIGSQLGVKTALRNLGLLIPVLIIIIGYRRRQNVLINNPVISNQGLSGG